MRWILETGSLRSPHEGQRAPLPDRFLAGCAPLARRVSLVPLALLTLLAPAWLGCEPTPGTPLPPDTAWADDTGVAPDAPNDAPAHEVAPVDVGLYDAPVVEAGNCELYPPGSGDRQALQCEPGSTCDVSGLWPLCAHNEEGGIPCGAIFCIGYGCNEAEICVGFND